MVLVAIVAVALGGLRYQRDQALRELRARWKADLDRAEDRVKWSEEMHREGYVSKATALADRLTLDKVKAELDEIGGR